MIYKTMKKPLCLLSAAMMLEAPQLFYTSMYNIMVSP